MSTIVTRQNAPWDPRVPADGSALFTERAGRVRLNGRRVTLKRPPLAGRIGRPGTVVEAHRVARELSEAGRRAPCLPHRPAELGPRLRSLASSVLDTVSTRVRFERERQFSDEEQRVAQLIEDFE